MNNEDKILTLLNQLVDRQDKTETILSTMRSDISTIKQEQQRTNERLDTLKNDVNDIKISMEDNFKATRSELVEAVETVGCKVDKLDRTIKTVEDVTAQNAFDVQLLKRQA